MVLMNSAYTVSFLATSCSLFLLATLVGARRLPFGGMTAFALSPSSSLRVVDQPDYELASLDMSHRWLDLVEKNQVEAKVQVSDGESTVSVRYGVRIATGKDQARCEEFVIQDLDGTEGPPSDKIRIINETLANLQADAAASSIKYKMDGDFCAQLQLVRTLRPPPTLGFSESTSSVPPPYNAETDSFVTGPLRLDLRPLVGTVSLPDLTTKWDIFHNVSPADTRGHFLLLPTLADREKNWRGQTILSDDCHDLVLMADSVRPYGSLLLGFNSVGAGASQNHIHCHSWPSPPLPLLKAANSNQDEGLDGWNCYAVSKVKSIYDFYDIEEGKVECSYLKYPVFCIQLSASREHLHLLAKALSASLDAFGDAPYNIGFLNRPPLREEDYEEDDEEEDDEMTSAAADTSFVDVFLFARSKERSSVLPSLKLGISEMMGLFHAQSDEELKILTTRNDSDEDNEVENGLMGQALQDVSFQDEEGHEHEEGHDHDEVENGPMGLALQDVSFQDEEGLWTCIKENLMKLEASDN
jgi:hypothetical protein